MPKVGAKEFPFTREGIAAAKQEAKTTGQPIKARKTYAETAHAQAERAKAGKSLKTQTGGAGTAALADGGANVATLGGSVTGKLAGDAPLSAQKKGDAHKPDPAPTPTGNMEAYRRPVNKPAGDGPADPAGPGDKPDLPKSKSLGGSGVTIKDAIKHPGALTEKAKAAGQSIDAFARAHQHDKDQTGDQARFYLGVLKKAGK